MMRVLFVCVGNICRSPLAELVLRQMVDERGIAMEVSSAGTLAEVGQGVDLATAACALRHDLDASEHTARQVTPAALRSADIVVALDPFAHSMLRGMSLILLRPPLLILRPTLNPWGMPEMFREAANETAYKQLLAVCDELVTLAERDAKG